MDGGQAHLEKILRHMEDLQDLNWDLLGQDYDGYDGDGPSGGISERMIAAGLGERGSLDIPLDVWNVTGPSLRTPRFFFLLRTALKDSP